MFNSQNVKSHNLCRDWAKIWAPKGQKKFGTMKKGARSQIYSFRAKMPSPSFSFDVMWQMCENNEKLKMWKCEESPLVCETYVKIFRVVYSPTVYWELELCPPTVARREGASREGQRGVSKSRDCPSHKSLAGTGGLIIDLSLMHHTRAPWVSYVKLSSQTSTVSRLP